MADHFHETQEKKNKKVKVTHGPSSVRLEDPKYLHSMGGADSYDGESLVEIGMKSFLNDEWQMLMKSGSNATSIGALSIGEAQDEHHQRQYTKTVLDHCIHACKDALASVPEGQVRSGCWDVLENTFHFKRRSFEYKGPKGLHYTGSARIGVVHRFSSPAQLVEHCKGDSRVARLHAVVEIPSECFDDKDYLNHRYHAKRILYLSHILQCLLEKNAYKEFGISYIGWCDLSQDMRKPNLCVRFQGIDCIEMSIGTAIPIDTFPLPRLAPDRNNLRSHVRRPSSEGVHAGACDPSVDEAILAPTPMYNGGIVDDMVCLHQAAELQVLGAEFPVLQDVITLLMAWADAHGLLLGNDGVNEALLLEIVKISLIGERHYNSQILYLFRGALQILAHEKKFVDCRKGFFMPHSELVDSGIPEAPPHKLWRKIASLRNEDSLVTNRVLFIDGTGWRNVARQISTEAFQQLQDCARSTAESLTNMPGPDALDVVLMKSSNPIMLYDIWCNCKVDRDTVVKRTNLCGSDPGTWLDLEEEVRQVSQKALGDRATVVRVLQSSYKVCTNSKGQLASLKPLQENIVVCCRLHPIKCTRSVDLGPPANAGRASDEFRQFWGDKSQLRRFQDGKICESIVWRISDWNKYRVIGDLLEFILTRHTSVTSVDLPILSLSHALIRSNISIEKEIRSERVCFDCAARLGKMLKSLDQVTLGIVNIQPISAVLRNAALYPPVPHGLAGDIVSNDSDSDVVPRCVPAVELLCQLEGSGKWPDNPDAYKKMKAAIGVQLAQSLLSTFSIYSIASEQYVDVLYEGFVFRLTLYTERDLLALKRKNESGECSIIPPTENIPLRQLHQGLISSIAAENPSFKLCCRLAKLWISKQYLGNHICEEAIELVCAAAYTTKVNIGGSRPASPELGFLTFLDIMANHPWDLQPLVLDRKDAEPSARLMLRLRAVDKAPAMFIVAPSTDNVVTCAGWTRTKPDKMILFRARALANKGIKKIGDSVLVFGSPSLPVNVFRHSMSDYDVVLHLKKEALPYASDKSDDISDDEMTHENVIRANIETEEKKYCMAVLSGIPKSLVKKRGATAIKKELLIGFDPVHHFVEALEETFKDVAIVCTDFQSGCTIGLKIRPKFLKPAPFSPNHRCSIFEPCKSHDNKSLITSLNFGSLAQDILSLGQGLVDTVEY